jgi:hypothetical protein
MTNDDFASASQSISQELRALQQRARSLSERLEARREGIREKYREQLDLMTGDQAVARRYLHDEDASHRLLALEVLGDHWTPDSEYYEQCERLVAEDPKLVVRAKALKRLGAHYAGTSNERLWRLAASAASENWEDETFAYGAYKVFCLIAGITPGPPSDVRDMKLFYINWDLMRPFVTPA